MAIKRSTPEAATDDEPAAVDEPPVKATPRSISTKATDYMGLALITPGTVSKDYMGRATTATVDHLGRLLLGGT